MSTNINGIFGVREMSVHHRWDEVTTISLELVAHPSYDARHLLEEKWDELFPSAAIVKCAYCGQWAARRTCCKHCGAPVD